MQRRLLHLTLAAFAVGALVGAVLLWATAEEGELGAGLSGPASVLVRVENAGAEDVAVSLAVKDETGRTTIQERAFTAAARRTTDLPVHGLRAGVTYDLVLSFRPDGRASPVSMADMLVEVGSCGPQRPVLFLVRVTGRASAVELGGMDDSCER